LSDTHQNQPVGAAASDAPPADPGSENDRVTDWALRAQQGDQAAMEALVLHYQPEISRLLWRFARNHADLEDLVQDTFLRVLRHLGSWRADRPFEHWLRRIASNAGRDYCRRYAVRRRWMVDPTPTNPDDAPPPEAVDPGVDPAARTAHTELKNLLAQLPPDDCALLTLHHLEGWDLTEIGRQFGWTTAATKIRAWRARGRLRSLYETHPSR
jgi:RNA polymerase sigma-70 factor (ECF subfamily)